MRPTAAYKIAIATTTNTFNVMEECNSTSFSDQITNSSLTMLFHMLNEKAPQYLIDIHIELQGVRIHDYSFRDEVKLRTPYCRLNTLKYSFFLVVLATGMIFQ